MYKLNFEMNFRTIQCQLNFCKKNNCEIYVWQHVDYWLDMKVTSAAYQPDNINDLFVVLKELRLVVCLHSTESELHKQ